MSQQINLYHNLPKPIQSPINVPLLLWVWGIFFAVLMLYFSIGIIQNQILSSKVTSMNLLTNDAQHRLAELHAKYPNLGALEPNLAALCKNKFSSYLEDFAKAIVPGTWLTDINISANGQFITLKGRALQAIEAQQYLEQLNKEPLLANLGLKIENLTHIVEAVDPTVAASVASEYLTFTITNTALSPT